MIQAGEIYEREDRKERVVVRRLAKGHPAVFYDPLPFDGFPGGGAFIGGNAEARFLACYPVLVGRMRFNGAYQLYRKEAARRREAEREVAQLRLALPAARVRKGLLRLRLRLLRRAPR